MADPPRTKERELSAPDPARRPDLIADVRWIAGSPLAWLVMIAAGILSGITALVAAGAGVQRAVPGSGTTAPIGDVMQLELLFGGVLVAGGFGLLGARSARPDATGYFADVRTALGRSILLLLALAPALVVVHAAATIVLSLAPTAWRDAVGRAGEPSTIGESTMLLVRGWLALLPFGAVGYASGVAMRRAMSGVLAVTAFLLVDAVAGTVVSTRLETWWSPIGNAAALAAATAMYDWIRAAGVTTVYVVVSLAVIARVTANGDTSR